jgi:ATP-dependent phosphoenolpyruvate carboxykinase
MNVTEFKKGRPLLFIVNYAELRKPQFMKLDNKPLVVREFEPLSINVCRHLSKKYVLYQVSTLAGAAPSDLIIFSYFFK